MSVFCKREMIVWASSSTGRRMMSSTSSSRPYYQGNAAAFLGLATGTTTRRCSRATSFITQRRQHSFQSQPPPPLQIFDPSKHKHRRSSQRDDHDNIIENNENDISATQLQQYLDGDTSADGQKKKKKKKSKKKNKLELFRADRVLANRSGKTRAECFKLLQKNAISILEEDNDDDNSNVEMEYIDDHNDQTPSSESRLRRVVMPAAVSSRLRIIKGPKEKIPMNARLFINSKFEVPNLPPLLTVYHKPKWVLSTMGTDSRGRRNLQDHVTFAFRDHMHPVGRLDYDSSGLLLFSSSGQLTQTLLHPKHEKEKEYVLVVTGLVQEDELKTRLQEGVELVDVSTKTRSKRGEVDSDDNDGDDAKDETISNKPTFMTRADLLDVQHWRSEQVAPYLQEIRSTLPPEYNVTDLNLRGYMDVLDATELSEIRLVVTEGKHRMVRRLLASCGHPVVSLKRERVGVIELKDLPEGSTRNLTTKEDIWAQSLVK